MQGVRLQVKLERRRLESYEQYAPAKAHFTMSVLSQKAQTSTWFKGTWSNTHGAIQDLNLFYLTSDRSYNFRASIFTSANSAIKLSNLEQVTEVIGSENIQKNMNKQSPSGWLGKMCRMKISRLICYHQRAETSWNKQRSIKKSFFLFVVDANNCAW